jgi:hypothetical protein
MFIMPDYAGLSSPLLSSPEKIFPLFQNVSILIYRVK